MGTRSQMRWIDACTAFAILVAAAHVPAAWSAGGGPVTIGVVAPQVQLEQGGVDSMETVRQALMAHLASASVRVIPLTTADQAGGGAQSYCDYVLETHVTQKHSAGSLFRRLAPLASLLPLAGAGGIGGSGNGALAAQMASQMAQNAAYRAAAASQQQAMEQMAGVQHSSIKRGDTVTFDYRLTAVGNHAVLASGSFKGTADADSQDLLNPLLAQVTNAVNASLGGQDGATAAPATGGASPPPSAGGSPVNCAQFASMPSSTMSVADCEKLMGAQTSYLAAANDPSAARPGDEQMTCAQINAELKQQQYAEPDQKQLAEAQSTMAKEQSMLKRQQAEVTATGIKQNAAIQAASATDTAVEVASGGTVRGRSAETLQQSFQAQDKAMGERMNAERRPTEQKMNTQIAGLAANAGSEVKANPRLARLLQLAQMRNCQGE
ncbi:MAG: hypothetical protein R3E69_12115 [Steroidobacteraceae bacterium]